jgi:protein TonB
MIAKKNPKLNDEKNRVVYFQLGLFITSAGMLMAFSWKSPKYDNYEFREEQLSQVPVEEIFVDKEEFPEVKPIEVKQEPAPIDPPIIEDIEPVPNKDEKHDLIDITKIKVDVSVTGGGEGPPGFEDILVEIPDKDAYLEGGVNNYLKSNLKYPEISVQFEEEGKIYLSFIIEKDGTPTNIKIMNGSAKSIDLRKEALRVIQNMPSWVPAEFQGERVRTKVKVPIVFSLD